MGGLGNLFSVLTRIAMELDPHEFLTRYFEWDQEGKTESADHPLDLSSPFKSLSHGAPKAHQCYEMPLDLTHPCPLAIQKYAPQTSPISDYGELRLMSERAVQTVQITMAERPTQTSPISSDPNPGATVPQSACGIFPLGLELLD